MRGKRNAEASSLAALIEASRSNAFCSVHRLSQSRLTQSRLTTYAALRGRTPNHLLMHA